MKRLTLSVLILISLFCVVACTSSREKKGYDGGSMDNYSNEQVEKQDKITALNRIKSAFHIELTESDLNQLRTKGSESSVGTSFVCEVKMIAVDEQGEESDAGVVINKYDATKDIFYADRTNIQDGVSERFEEWYYYGNGHRYYVVKKGENVTKEESDTYGNYEYIYGQIFEGVEKSLEFDNPDSENFYINYRYQGEGEDGDIQFKPKEDEELKDNLNWIQKVGYVQSFIKQVKMDVFSNGKCYNKLEFNFKGYGADVNIPEIPSV